jgi:hypothetical protein
VGEADAGKNRLQIIVVLVCAKRLKRDYRALNKAEIFRQAAHQTDALGCTDVVGCLEEVGTIAAG